jgi:hypothetical protein
MSIKLFNKLFVFIPVLAAIACSTLVPKPGVKEADIEREEQAVYFFFIGPGNGPFLILQETSTGISEQSPQELRASLKSGFKNITNETIDSYLARNEKPGQLSPDMKLGVDYTLLTTEELAKISSQPNWGDLLAWLHHLFASRLQHLP